MSDYSERDKLGRLVKGITPWNKGKTGVYSEEVLKIMSEAKKGKHVSPETEFKKGHIPWIKGKKGLCIKGSEKGWFKKGHAWTQEIKEKMLENLKKRILLRPNLKINENLAYIIGLLKGDGNIYTFGGRYRITFDNTNQTIAINFFNSIKKIGLNPFIREVIPSNGVGKLKQYRVIAYSKEFCEFYKSLTKEKLAYLLDTKEKIVGFIRGFYEAEGSIHKQKYGIVIQIYNTDLALIKLIKSLLEKIGLNFHLNGPYENNGLGIYNSKPIYRVQIGSKDIVFNFLKLIKPSVKNLDL